MPRAGETGSTFLPNTVEFSLGKVLTFPTMAFSRGMTATNAIKVGTSLMQRGPMALQ
jgi:hypothetical protein